MKLVSAIPVDDRPTECPGPQYLAGYFDGEGSIFLTRSTASRKRFKNNEARFRIGVSLANTYKPTLDAVCAKYGGALCTNSNHKKPNCRIAWSWRAYASEAAHFLTDVLPFLHEKRGRAIAALFYLDTLMWPKNWRELSGEQKAIRQAVFRYLDQNPNPSGHALSLEERLRA